VSARDTRWRARPPTVLAVVCLAVAVGATGAIGCGDDEPETTTPTTEPATLTGPTGPTSDDGPGEGQAAGGDVDLEDGTVTPPPETDPESLPGEPEDSPQNDTPPPPGSAAEEFEQFCDENPEACG
jgi:hypothetical protein